MRTPCVLALCLLVVGCSRETGKATSGGEKVLRIAIPTDGPKSLDPVRGSTVYDNRACAQVYETLLQYKYYVRPLTLEPLLLEEMPKIAEDGRTYSFKLKQGVYFQDDPCFSDGKGRELVAQDVIYSWKRMANRGNEPQAWWLFKNSIVGFDAYRTAQNDAVAKGGKFDYEAPVEGLKIKGNYEFDVVLIEPVTRFLYVLAMFQTSAVAREAVEKYGTGFSRHPVGTGPYRLEREEDWVAGKSMVLKRNPTFREEYFPSEQVEGEKGAGTPAKPQRLPICDRLEYTFFTENQPRWLEFLGGKIDYVTVPAENFEEGYVKRTRKIRPEFRKKGITSQAVPLFDFIFRGFNMEDPLVGGYTDKKRALRKALHLAFNLEEFNDAFYNGICILYDGPIPPGLEGYPPNGRAPISWRETNIDRAKQFLAEAGYPDGKGLPAIDYWINKSTINVQFGELLQRQFGKINVKLNVKLVDFSELIQAVSNKKAPIFSFAWGTDYPDAENNLALFYGPNEAPDSNSFNYKNPEFDRLYEKIRSMRPSPERTKIYAQMRDMVLKDVPYLGSMARTRYYLVHPWLKNFKATEGFWNWIKYLDVDESKRR